MILLIESNKMNKIKQQTMVRSKNNATKTCLTVFKIKEIKFKENKTQKMKRTVGIQLFLLKNNKGRNNLLNRKKKSKELKRRFSINLRPNKKKETEKTLNGSSLWTNFIENKLRRKLEFWIKWNQIKKNNKKQP